MSPAADIDFKSFKTYDWQFSLDNRWKYCNFVTYYHFSSSWDQISSTEERFKAELIILIDAVPIKAKLITQQGDQNFINVSNFYV